MDDAAGAVLCDPELRHIQGDVLPGSEMQRLVNVDVLQECDRVTAHRFIQRVLDCVIVRGADSRDRFRVHDFRVQRECRVNGIAVEIPFVGEAAFLVPSGEGHSRRNSELRSGDQTAGGYGERRGRRCLSGSVKGDRHGCAEIRLAVRLYPGGISAVI